MDDYPIEDAIIKNLLYIKQNVTSFDTVVDVLVTKKIIGLRERSNFVSHGISQNDKIQEVIDVVLKKEASDEFIAALIDSGNEHVAEQILTLDEKGFADYTQSPNFTSNVIRPRARDRLKDAYKDIARLKREKHGISSDIKSLQDQHHEQIMDLQRQLKEKDEKIDALNEEIRNLKKSIDDISKEHATQMNKVNQTLEQVLSVCKETNEKVTKNEQRVTELEEKKKPPVRQNNISKNRPKPKKPKK